MPRKSRGGDFCCFFRYDEGQYLELEEANRHDHSSSSTSGREGRL